MTALQQLVDRNNLSSPEVNMVSSKTAGSRKDLNLWGGTETKKCENESELESYEIEFQTVMGDYSAYSPPLWASTSHIDSNLLPHNHYYSSPSPKSRLQVIQDGRKELMNMFQGLSESSSEQSLQDIVDNGIIIQQVQDKGKKVQGPNIQNAVKRQISRSQSMNNEIFLLKMFLPSCLSYKKKTTFGTHTRVSRMPSIDGCEEPIDKERWSISSLISRKNRSNSSGSSSSGSTSFNISDRSRNGDGNFTPGCWTYGNLCKSRKRRGCLF
ncbi:uncharacterized protein LOC141712324 isoform X2 [Apium graveolens]|uniref:uncharacterized protein LOC141712324 isoform X2 n=1 Tax=Apium graveolens TaxID=4045 RepID=UPI003D7A8B79